MRLHLAGLLLCAALNVSQAQEAPPLDTSEVAQTLDVVLNYDMSEARTSGRFVVLDGENLIKQTIDTRLSGLWLMGWPDTESDATNLNTALPDEARAQFESLNEIPADKPRSIAVCLDRLQRLQDAYTRLDKLDEAVAIRERLEEYRARQAKAQINPGNLIAFRGQAGKSFLFAVTGCAVGPIHGSEIYTDDSELDIVAVHAGALRVGQKGLVKVTILDGQRHYQGAERNGVTSRSYEASQGSYRVEAVKSDVELPQSVAPQDALAQNTKDLLAKLAQYKTANVSKNQIHAGVDALRTMESAYAADCQLDAALAIREARLHFVGDALGAVPNPGLLTNYRNKIGQSFYFYVRGQTPGSVWGDGLYTDDSALGAVTVHAGLLRVGQQGLVKVTLRPGRDSYEGAERHGVISQSYAVWQGSYSVERVNF